MPRLLILFFIFSFSLIGFGQPSAANKRFAALFEESKYKELTKLLDEIRTRDPGYFEKQNLDYLYARAAEKSGEISIATAYYQSVASRPGPLKIYSLKHLSRIMRETGNLGLERVYLSEILLTGDSELNAVGASQRLVRNHYESSDFDAAIDAVQHGVNGSGVSLETAEDREIQVLLANSLRRSGQGDEARKVYEGVVISRNEAGRPDDYSLAAVKGLDLLEDNDADPKTVAGLSAETHKQRAEIFQHNRDFVSARVHFRAIVDNHSGDSLVPSAMYQIGRGFVQERNYEEALQWFQRLRNEFPEDKLLGPALYGAAGAQANLDKTNEAVSSYERYIAENPKASNLARAYLNIIDAYRDAGEMQKALEWCSKAQLDLKGQVGEAAALFSEVRIQIAAEEWNRALSALDRLKELKNLGGMRIAGGTYKSEVEFLRGFVREKAGKKLLALETYRSIKDGRKEYYGWRALLRTSALNKKPKKKKELDSVEATEKTRQPKMPNPVADPYDELDPLGPTSLAPRYPLPEDSPLARMKEIVVRGISGQAKALLDLGLYEEAAPEVELQLRANSGINGDALKDFDSNTAFTLAIYFSKGGFADRAIAFIEPEWKKIPRDFPIRSIPKEHARLLYPVPFKDSLIRYGTEKKVDPRFILSIMRQESRFRADIKSVAAARGSMQFITNTSTVMAKELGITTFDQNELYAPDTAVKFGAHYISRLFTQFPEQEQAVAASYNGGEDRMARWLKRSMTQDPDRYVSEVVFAQTKDYVFRVMTNYRMYRLLYDRNLRPKTSE